MITPKWFVNGSEYHPQLATYRPLVNGKEAFDAVYRAIDAAEKSVCIICWGFQPSMYFVRDGTQMMIGQLLEKKAKQGTMVRVLCWAFERISIGGGFRLNVTGHEKGLNESNTPGRWALRISDRPASETDEQYAYDVHWYTMYDRKADWVAKDRRTWRDARNLPKNNLLFYSRSYSKLDTAALQSLEYTDKELSWKTLAALQQLPSHHQKMVLVDYEDPQAAVGFVMGHNMLDFYWDTSDHSGTPKPPNVGRNGSSPLHDYSSRVTGPIIGDLFHNFAHAWEKETGESLPKPNFCSYPLLGNDVTTLCQILRTQPQPENVLTLLTKKSKPKQDIADCYMQAVSNATQCIVIENQYFRWPPLAEKINESAARMAAWGRSPEKHGYLYLFVITNSSDGGMGAGTVNTYRMLEALGRADRIPEVARHQRGEAMDREIKAVEKDLKAADKALKSALDKRKAIDDDARLLTGVPGANVNARYTSIQEEIARLEARKAQLEARKRELEQRKARLKPPAGSKQEGEAILPREVPGLKVHIATLVAPDTAPGKSWQEVYIHAKLMMIDDTFMTLGSTNINTRSMQTDTELNIMHDRFETTKPLRERQWEKYTWGKDENGNGVARIPIGTPLKEAFRQWGDLMNDNAVAKRSNQSPLAQLHEFLRADDKISNND
jgi:phosphatidylserine/phosphatidylglycerophosphate/cardiolipin synthase-like enzyme